MVSATVPKDLMVPDGTGDVEEVPEKTLGSADIFSNNEQRAEVFDKCLQAVDRRISSKFGERKLIFLTLLDRDFERRAVRQKWKHSQFSSSSWYV